MKTMTMTSLIPARLARRLGRDRRGSILIEVALCLPVILILFTAGFEIGRFALLDMKVSRAAMTLADLVAQTENEIYENDIDGLMAAMPHIGRPFSFDSGNTQVIITSVAADGDGNPIVCWQEEAVGDLGEDSQIGTPGTLATMPDTVDMQEGDTAIVTEVYYDYAPFLFDTVMNARRISSMAVFRPRLAKLDVLQPGDVTAC